MGGSWHWLRIASREVQILRHTDKEEVGEIFIVIFLFCDNCLLPEVDEKTIKLNWQIWLSCKNGKPRCAVFKQVLEL